GVQGLEDRPLPARVDVFPIPEAVPQQHLRFLTLDDRTERLRRPPVISFRLLDLLGGRERDLATSFLDPLDQDDLPGPAAVRGTLLQLLLVAASLAGDQTLFGVARLGIDEPLAGRASRLLAVIRGEQVPFR